MKYKIQIRRAGYEHWETGNHLYETKELAEMVAKALIVPSEIPGNPEYHPEWRIVEVES